MKHLFTLSLLFSTALHAQDYSLSPTFGSGGVVRAIPGPQLNEAYAHAFTTDGKLLLTGTGYDNSVGNNSFHVSMMKVDTMCGALDTTFGVGGSMVHFHEQRTLCFDMALQPDGGIVGCGQVSPSNAGSEAKCGVYRYLPNGDVDSTFNGTGYHRLFANEASRGAFSRVFVHADGTITCLGQNADHANAAMNGVVAVRFTHDGELDTTFNHTGVASVAIEAGIVTGAVRPDGRVLVVGSLWFSGSEVKLAQFNADGSLDLSFGVGGLVTSSGVAIGGFGEGFVRGVSIMDDGRFLISGPAYSGSDWMMARFLANGTLDATYGASGISAVPMQDPSVGYDHHMLADGSSIQFGRVTHDHGRCLKRDADGQVETSFGVNGVVDINAGVAYDYIRGGTVLPGGRIIAYGGNILSGEMTATMLTSDPLADALPAISFTGTELITTGSGSFQWYLNGDPIMGATGNAHTPLANGTYTVSMSLSSDCEYISAPYEMLNVGIGEATLSTIRLLQNPVEVSITVLNSGATQPFTLRDMSGRTVRTGQLVGGTNTIDVVSCASGIYLLDVGDEGGSQRFRVVKQ